MVIFVTVVSTASFGTVVQVDPNVSLDLASAADHLVIPEIDVWGDDGLLDTCNVHDHRNPRQSRQDMR